MEVAELLGPLCEWFTEGRDHDDPPLVPNGLCLSLIIWSFTRHAVEVLGRISPDKLNSLPLTRRILDGAQRTRPLRTTVAVD